jgi:hypothetical protein
MPKVQSVGAIPLTVRHEGVVRRVIGPEVDFTLCAVYREDPQHRAQYFMLHPVVKATDMPFYFDQPFKIALVLQAQSIETEPNLLRVEIIWNGQWSDDTERMSRNLDFDHRSVTTL